MVQMDEFQFTTPYITRITSNTMDLQDPLLYYF